MEKFFLIVLLALLYLMMFVGAVSIGFMCFLFSPWMLAAYIVFVLLILLACVATANCDSIEG